MKQQSDQLLADALIELRSLLLKCGPVKSHGQLRAVFIDPRVEAWRNQLPERSNPEERVESIIELLLHENDASENNVLVSFLQVLSERADPRTACHRQLKRMTVKLRSLVSSAIASGASEEMIEKPFTHIENYSETHFHGTVEGNILTGQGNINQQGEKDEPDNLQRSD